MWGSGNDNTTPPYPWAVLEMSTLGPKGPRAEISNTAREGVWYYPNTVPHDPQYSPLGINKYSAHYGVVYE